MKCPPRKDMELSIGAIILQKIANIYIKKDCINLKCISYVERSQCYDTSKDCKTNLGETCFRRWLWNSNCSTFYEAFCVWSFKEANMKLLRETPTCETAQTGYERKKRITDFLLQIVEVMNIGVE